MTDLPVFHVGSGTHHDGVTIFPVFSSGPSATLLTTRTRGVTLNETAGDLQAAHLATADLFRSGPRPWLGLRGDLLSGGHQSRLFANSDVYSTSGPHSPLLFGTEESSVGGGKEHNGSPVPRPEDQMLEAPRLNFMRGRAPLGVRRLLHGGDRSPHVGCNFDKHQVVRTIDSDFPDGEWLGDLFMDYVHQYPIRTCWGMNAPYLPLRAWNRGPEGLRGTDWYERQEHLYEWIGSNQPVRGSTSIRDVIRTHTLRGKTGGAAPFVPMRGQTGAVIALGGTVTELVVFGHPSLFAQRRTELINSALIDAHLLGVPPGAPPAWASQAERLVHDALHEFTYASPAETNQGELTAATQSSSFRCEANGHSALTEAVFHTPGNKSAPQLAVFSAYPARAF